MTLRSLAPIAALACAAVLPLAGCAGGAGAFVESATFDDALLAAANRDGLVVVDFYATWCGPCKSFAADVETDDGLRGALAKAAFVRVDAEAEDGGLELAERFAIESYPTFVVVDAEGNEIDRWAGYGTADGFVERLGRTLADPVPLDARVTRFEAEPTVADAERLAEAFLYAGELPRAVGYLERAIELAPDDAARYRGEIVSAHLRGLGGAFTVEDVAASAAALIAEPDAKAETLGYVGDMLAARAERHELTDVLEAYLPSAIDAVESDRDRSEAERDGDDKIAFLDGMRTRLLLAQAIHVDGDLARAVELKRDSMPEGWLDDAVQLNSFAWWCFEHETNVAEATELALRGVELAEPGSQRAMILDTAAELCNLAGDCGEALALMNRAIEDDPENDHYREQRDRFAERLESQEGVAAVL